MKLILLLVVLVFAVEKQEVVKTVAVDTLRPTRTDTMTVIRREETKITKTWKDTVRLVKVDTVKTSKFDTLVTVRKVSNKK